MYPDHSILEARDVSFAYGGKGVLHNVSLRLEPGRLTMLLGPNGSGKTTLLKLLAGRLAPQSGSVCLGEASVTDLSGRTRASRIAVVPQKTGHAPGFTVREMVMTGRYACLSPLLPPSSEDEDIVTKAIGVTDLTSLADRPCSALSGGEYQRVALASAFAARTPYLLMDEPFSALDPLHAGGMMDEFLRLRTECGILMITHDLFLAANYADRIVFLKKGEMIASGTRDEVMREDILRQVYDLPFELHALADGRIFPVSAF